MNFYDDDDKPRLKDSLFSHIGGVIVGFCVGALAAYAVIAPSVDRLKANAEDAVHRAADATENLMHCQSLKSDARDAGAGSTWSPKDQRIDELTAEIAREKKERAHVEEVLQANTRQLVAEGALLADQKNVATVLYEPAPPDRVQTVMQAMVILSGKPFQIPVPAKMQPRWYIPGKVVPILYAGAPYSQNDQFIWVDAKGGHAGPFPARTYQ